MPLLRRYLEARQVENPDRPLTDSSLLSLLGGDPVEAGVSVSQRNAYGVSAVYRAVALLSGVIGAMPWDAYRRCGGSRAPIDSPAIDNPHPDKTPFEVKEWIGQSLLSWGNSYSLKLRNRAGRVMEIEPLHPGDVRVERKRDWRTANNPTGKRFTVADGAAERTYVPWDLLHIPGLSYDGLVGMSPISLARQGIGLAIAAENFGARMFSRGALIPGVLQTTQKLTEPAANRLKEDWRRKTAGADHQWEIPVLDAGAEFKAIGLPPADAQFLETRRFAVTDVARWFGLPPHLLGDVERSTSWGTGIEQQNMQMLTYTADPWLVRIEQRVGREVVADPGVYVKFNRGALLRPDTAARFLAYQRAINNGWMSADEIRALEDHDPIPGGQGQTFYRPGNLTPINGQGVADADNDDAA
jgi:HK97 family phage portal protein